MRRLALLATLAVVGCGTAPLVESAVSAERSIDSAFASVGALASAATVAVRQASPTTAGHAAWFEVALTFAIVFTLLHLVASTLSIVKLGRSLESRPHRGADHEVDHPSRQS